MEGEGGKELTLEFGWFARIEEDAVVAAFLGRGRFKILEDDAVA